MIQILSSTHGPGHGAERVLCELLEAWPPENQPISVVAPVDSAVFSCAVNHRIPAQAFPATRDSLACNLLALKAVKHSLPDYCGIHAWSARSFELAQLLGRHRGVPASGTLHDHPSADHNGYLRRHLMKRSANSFTALACVSQAVADACRDARYRCRLSVVRNGLSNTMSKAREPSPTVRIGFAGMYASWKGFSVVATWIDRLTKGVTWNLYGSTAPSLEPQASLLASRLPESVYIHGRQDIETIFDNTDVLIQASTAFDPLPTVLIEAARAGIPVVASSLGGAAEVVEHGKTGLIFDPSTPEQGFEQLRRLIDNSELRAQMGQNARLRYETAFTVQGMVDRYQEFWTAAFPVVHNRAAKPILAGT